MKKIILYLFMAILAFSCIGADEWTTVRGEKAAFSDESLPPEGSRILVVAPHCDDETLGSGILLHRAVEKGIPVKVVVVTNGDGYAYGVDRDFYTVHPTSQEFIKFGYQRQSESMRAMRDLGVSRQDVIFLGYPDRGIAHLWSENWDQDQPYISQYTKAEADPYHGTFDPKVAYTGENLLRDIKKIVDEYQPTDIYFPHPDDAHVDHWAVNAFVKYLLEIEGKKIREHLYIVHCGTWPEPRQPKPSQLMTPPAQLSGNGMSWKQFRFFPGEAVLKTDAILTYATQVRVMRSFLLSFVRSSELYGELPDYHLLNQNTVSGEGKLGSKDAAIADPIGDTLPVDVDKAADLKTIYSCVDDNNLIIEIEAAIPVKNDVTYHIRGRLFAEKDPVSRFDIQISEGKITVNQFAKNSMTEIPGTAVEQMGGRYRVSIPLQSLIKARAIFLSVDTSVGPYSLDKTAWRMLRLPAAEN